MSSTLYSPAHAASIGEVLDVGFRIFKTSLLQSLPFGLLAMVAGQLPHLYEIGAAHITRPFGGGDPLWWLFYAVGAVLAITFINAILIGQAASARGARLRWSAAWLDGVRLTPVAVGVFISFLLALAACFTPLLLLPRGAWPSMMPLLAIPAAYLAIALSSAWAAALLGRRGVAASLRHSWVLVRGAWWRTLSIYLIALAMLAVFYTLAAVVAGVLVSFAGTGNVAVITAVSAEVAAALAAVGVPFYCAVALAVYCDLEARTGAEAIPRPAGNDPALG
jgi:hypothetical protein